MAKIARTTQTIFALSATNIGQFGSAEAGTFVLSSSVATLQALAAYELGWSDAVISGERLPCLEEINALHYIETSQLSYLFQEGIPEYDAGTNYFQHSIVKKAGTYQLYGSLIDNNLGNALTNGSDWKLLVDLSAPLTTLPISSRSFTSSAYSVVTGDIGQIIWFTGGSGTVNINPATLGANNIIGVTMFGGGGSYNLTITATSGIILNGSQGTATSLYINGVSNNAYPTVLLTSDGTNLYVYGGNSPRALAGLSHPVKSSFKNMNGGWTSNTVAFLTADELTLENSVGETVRSMSVSVNFNSATSGAGGLDTGSIAASTWYYGFVIYNPSSNTTNSLFSSSPTAPTLPTGYTFASGCVTVFRTDGSSHFIGFKQFGRDWQYVVGSNLATARLMASGSAGSSSTPTYVAVSISNFVPTSIAAFISGYITQITSNFILAPNNSYGANQSSTNSPPVSVQSTSATIPFNFVLESANIYWASDSNASLFCLGFTLNI